MRRRSILAAALLAALMPLPAFAAGPQLNLALPKGVQAGAVMPLGDEKPKPPSPDTAFDVDPDGLPVIAQGTALKLFGAPRALLTLGGLAIDDFAFMRDGRPLFVSKGRLAALSPKGAMLGPALPAAGMRIRPAGDDTAYVFGGASEPENRNVYLFKRDGTVAKLASLPVAVTSVAGDETTTYVATDNMILKITLDQQPSLVLRASDPVLSIELAPQGGLFYSTRSAVGYIERNGGSTEFLRGDGGILRARKSQLFVLLMSGTLLRIGPIDAFGSAFGSAGQASAAHQE